jgi:phage terminase small subunit
MNAKHELFILEYLKTGNATQAAIAAGYSPRSAATQGSRLLADEEIAADVARRQAAANNAPAAPLANLESILAEVEAARDIATASRNASAMIAATQMKARLLGIDGPADDDGATLADAQKTELRTAANLLGDAAESVGLSRDATPAQIIGSLSERALVPPAVFKLMHEKALQEKATTK